MRCNKHPCDLSSSVGVCASCLRERLFSLISTQARQQTLIEEEIRQKSDPHLLFPRSVSPYIFRLSDSSSLHNDRRFYSTPQVGPTFTTTRIKKKHRRFARLSSLFRSSKTDEPDLDHLDPDLDSRVSKISWFSSLLSGRGKKQSELFSDDVSIRRPRPPTNEIFRRPQPSRNRGMSPTVEYEDKEGSPESEYSSESDQARRKTTTAPPDHRRAPSQNGRNLSGFAFCLSPLLRASPSRQWNQKEPPPSVMVFSGENGRRSGKGHVSTSGSLFPNRSKKLTDIGRYTQ